jgi:hypothetical protein
MTSVEVVWVNLGIMSLRLLEIVYVDVKGSSRHAKLVNWSSRERNRKGLTPIDLVLAHMMTIGHIDFMNMDY